MPIFSSMEKSSSLPIVIVVGGRSLWESGSERRNSWRKRSGKRRYRPWAGLCSPCRIDLSTAETTPHPHADRGGSTGCPRVHGTLGLGPLGFGLQPTAIVLGGDGAEAWSRTSGSEPRRQPGHRLAHLGVLGHELLHAVDGGDDGGVVLLVELLGDGLQCLPRQLAAQVHGHLARQGDLLLAGDAGELGHG